VLAAAVGLLLPVGDWLWRRRHNRRDGRDGRDACAASDSLRYVIGIFRLAGDVAGRFAPRLRGGIFCSVCAGCSGSLAVEGTLHLT
jgi:hypothetical protein